MRILFFGLITLVGCTHVLADRDVQALQDSQTLEASAYRDLADAGTRTMIKVQTAYCSTRGVLVRSNAQIDAGIPCPQ